MCGVLSLPFSSFRSFRFDFCFHSKWYWCIAYFAIVYLQSEEEERNILMNFTSVCRYIVSHRLPSTALRINFDREKIIFIIINNNRHRCHHCRRYNRQAHRTIDGRCRRRRRWILEQMTAVAVCLRYDASIEKLTFFLLRINRCNFHMVFNIQY